MKEMRADPPVTAAAMDLCFTQARCCPGFMIFYYL